MEKLVSNSSVKKKKKVGVGGGGVPWGYFQSMNHKHDTARWLWRVKKM